MSYTYDMQYIIKKKDTKEKEENKGMGVWREIMKKEWL